MPTLAASNHGLNPDTNPGIGRILLGELAPYPGRIGLSWRMAVLCMGVVAFSMSQQIPEVALSCYLIFFASKDNAGSSIALGIALILGATLGIALALVFFMFSADQPLLRLLLVILFTFGGMYFSQASRLGPIAGTIGFVFAFAITLFDYVPLPELLVQALTWMWKVVFVPMALLVLLNILAGRKPAVLMRQLVVRRLEALAVLLRSDRPENCEAVRALLETGNHQAKTWEKVAGIFSHLRAREIRRLGDMVDTSYELMAVILAELESGYRFAPSAMERAVLAERIEELAVILRKPRTFNRAASNQPHPGSRAVGPINIQKPLDRLRDLASDRGTPLALAGAAQKEPFFKPDAFSNPDHVRFALKTVLAVMICYFTYTALGWFEIHTAMITCFYVALGNTAETVHKLTLRLAGCLFGAAMGVMSLLFLMPHMSDIGHLMLLVGGGSFIAAWIANGSERISYMGWQMALAFFLCVLHGSGPTFDLSVASDRIIGIVFGNVIMAIIFSNIWPVSASGAVRDALSKAMSALAALAGGSRNEGRPKGIIIEQAFASLADAGRKTELLVFEAGTHRGRKETAQLQQLLSAARGLVSPLVLIGTQDNSSSKSRPLPRQMRVAAMGFERELGAWLTSMAAHLKSNTLSRSEKWFRGPLRRAEAAFGRGQNLPNPLRKTVSQRLHIYEEIDAKLSAMAESGPTENELNGNRLKA